MPEPEAAVDVAKMRAWHHEQQSGGTFDLQGGICGGCSESWPCDASRLLNAYESEHARVERLATALVFYADHSHWRLQFSNALGRHVSGTSDIAGDWGDRARAALSGDAPGRGEG